LSYQQPVKSFNHNRWDAPTNGNNDSGFRVRDLIGAIQGGETSRIVRAYLTHFSEVLGSDTMKDRLNDAVDGYPGIFFVVETGKADMVKAWISHAGAGNHTYRTVPILGFAIALCRSYRVDMPMVVKTLLSSGYSVDVIPQAFYSPLQRDLPHEGPSETELQDMEKGNTAWCVPNIRVRLAHALNVNFTVRYDLDLASRDRAPSGANKKLAEVHKASELFGMRYFLIGQTPAYRLLLDRFLA
jgi:hypothetical protein